MVTTPEQDIYYQYSDGRDLLSAALIERRQLLRKLEKLAKVPQETRNDRTVIRFDTASGQTLLYELSFVADRIETLVLLVNVYAEKCGKPTVEITETNLS